MAWSRGELSREDLAYYAGQYYQQEGRFSRFVSAVHSNCPELAARQALIENLRDEDCGTENHPELWLRFAESVGAAREMVKTADVSPKTRACVEAFEASRADRGWPAWPLCTLTRRSSRRWPRRRWKDSINFTGSTRKTP